MLLILFLLGIVQAAQGAACSLSSDFDPYCTLCRRERTCADIYHITHNTGATACSATDLAAYKSMFHHFYSDQAYGMPGDVDTKKSFCDTDDNDTAAGGYKPLLLYYQWGPSCNDGETFEMYPAGQSGFCYCGSNCDKSYSNPPMNTLLTTLVIVIGVNITFNAIVLFYRYRDNRQPSKNTISTTGGTVRKMRSIPSNYP